MAEVPSPADAARTKERAELLTRLVGGALVAGSLVFGSLAFIAAGAATTALYAWRQRHNRRVKEESLLDLYREDVAALLAKPANQVTLKDLRRAAAPVEKGGKGITAIRKQLDFDDRYETIKVGSETINALVIVAGLVAMDFTFPGLLGHNIGLPTLMVSMTAGGALALGHRLIDAIGTAFFGKQAEEQGISPALLDISRQITQEPATPVQVFAPFVEADPKLQQEIKQRYGNDFSKLTIVKKNAVVQDYEPQYRAIALTQEINDNNISPSLIGFLAYGQGSEQLPGYAQYMELFKQPVLSVAEVKDRDTIHTQRLRDERAQEKPITLH